MISDLSLMKIQVGTLFVHDHDERLRFINEPYRPEDHPAPVVFIGRRGSRGRYLTVASGEGLCSTGRGGVGWRCQRTRSYSSL